MNQIRSKLLLALCIAQLLPCAQPALAKSLKLKPIVQESMIELYAPAFIPNSSTIAVVRKGHEPDFSEAECYPEAELTEIQNRKDKDPRWADPEVTIYTLEGKDKNVVDWGWSPEPSGDGTKLYYIHQLNPISGKRVLAETQKGNELFAYDIEKGTRTKVAEPTVGYLDHPAASQTENKVAYSICDNTNGAYGGPVGIGVYDASKNEAKIVLEPAKNFKLYDLIGPVKWSKGNLVTVRQTACGEGIYLADAYKYDVLNLTGEKPVSVYKRDTEVKNFGETGLTVYPTPDGNIDVVEKDRATKVDLAQNKILDSRSVPKFIGNRSPNDHFEATTNDGKLVVTSFDKSKTYTAELPGQLTSIQWSPDSKRLAIVLTLNKKKGGIEVFDKDCLYLVDIPQ